MRKLIIGGFAILALLVSIIVTGCFQHWSTDGWAAWGQWIGGVGAIAAAVIAIVIAISGWRQSERQIREQNKRSLASLFGVWIRRPNQHSFNLYYMNRSPLPVYDVTVKARIGSVYVDIPLGTLPPTQEEKDRNDATGTVKLHAEREAEKVSKKPMSKKDEFGDQRGIPETITAYWNIVDSIQLDVTFRDGNGNTWKRLNSGELEPNL